MEGLVDYGSSSSSDTHASDLRNKKVKRAQATCEESEVCSSVVQVDPNERTDQLTRNPATVLLEMGCSFDQIVHAISLCGHESRVEDLFDFIQACEYPLEEQRSALNLTVHEGNEQKSIEPSTFPFHTNCSGSKEKEKVVAQTHAFPEEASCSRSHHLLQDVGQSTSPLEELRSMGFTQAQVQRASEECNSIDSDVLIEFLLGNKAVDCHLQSLTQPEVREVDPHDHMEEKLATPLQRLQGMGYSLNRIQKASEECNSIDFDVLLEYLVMAEEENVQDQLLSEVDSSEGEDFERESISKLQSMGFPYSAIMKAIDVYGSHDFERILDVLNGLEKLKDNSAVDVVKEFTRCGTHGESTYTSPSKNRISYGEGCLTTSERVATKWTCNMEKLWCSYMGTRKKNDFLPQPESDDSDTDILESTWEEKPPKIKSHKRKLEFHECKDIDKLKPHVGKMMGYGIPGLFIGRPKPLPYLMCGPPYFYFENVAGVPNNEWDTIKRHFNGVDPEFTDSKFFSASRRPRGYVHNLPVEGRTPLPCVPPMIISEAFPDTQQYWPSWDTREKLNCINTRKAPDSLCGLIRKLFALHNDGDMPFHRQQEIVQVCKKWNLVWVGPGQTAPLEPHEIELLLGFDRDHTRGCSSITERYDALGNSFQIHTVAYHLSTLKSLYPNGIIVLSLFSGIGGAEVALHKLGIYLKVVIAVEKNEKVRGVLVSWWKKSGQKGELKLRDDVRNLTHDVLAELVDEVGPIDLIIGGSPCNNLSGNNRVSRVGLNGNESSLFFEFPRILNIVTQIMRDRGFL